MTENTVFSTSVLEEILESYDLGELVDSKAFAGGAVQTNLLLQTTKGRFAFRYYRQGRSKGSVLFEVNLVRYLKKRNYPCPAPLRNKYGKFVGSYNRKPYVIFEFIEGVHLDNPDETQKRELVRKVAELHNITRNYRPSYKKYRWNYDVDLCQHLAEEKAAQIGTANSRKKLEWFENELQHLNLPVCLPKGICHCDFHFTNVLFLDGRFNALIDFDDANYTFLIFDLVSLAEPFVPSFRHHNWHKYKATDDVFDFSEVRLVISEYEKYRPLNNNEQRHVFDVYKLSFLLDCVWYFERGDPRDFFEKRKIEYLNNLGPEDFYRGLFADIHTG